MVLYITVFVSPGLIEVSWVTDIAVAGCRLVG